MPDRGSNAKAATPASNLTSLFSDISLGVALSLARAPLFQAAPGVPSVCFWLLRIAVVGRYRTAALFESTGGLQFCSHCWYVSGGDRSHRILTIATKFSGRRLIKYNSQWARKSPQAGLGRWRQPAHGHRRSGSWLSDSCACLFAAGGKKPQIASRPFGPYN